MARFSIPFLYGGFFGTLLRWPAASHVVARQPDLCLVSARPQQKLLDPIAWDRPRFREWVHAFDFPKILSHPEIKVVLLFDIKAVLGTLSCPHDKHSTRKMELLSGSQFLFH